MDAEISPLVHGNGEIELDVNAAIETGNGVPRRLVMLEFGVDFEVRVGIESGELVVPLRVGDVRLDIIGFFVVQVDDTVGDGILAFVDDVAMNATQLGAITLILGVDGNAGKN